MSVATKKVTPSEALLKAVQVMREYGLDGACVNVVWTHGSSRAEITVGIGAFEKVMQREYVKTQRTPYHHRDGNGNTWATINVDGCVVKALD